jgi:hypothetical protein
MAKTITRTVRKPLSLKPGPKRADTAYPVEQEDLDQQQERLRKAAAEGAAALRTQAPAEQTPAPATVPSKPLTPLAALWPDPTPSKGESRASPGPKFQKTPVTAIAPKPTPARAAPLPQPAAQSPQPKSRETETVAAPAAKPTAPQTLNVSFALHKPNAKRVSLCGEFNG